MSLGVEQVGLCLSECWWFVAVLREQAVMTVFAFQGVCGRHWQGFCVECGRVTACVSLGVAVARVGGDRLDLGVSRGATPCVLGVCGVYLWGLSWTVRGRLWVILGCGWGLCQW